MAGISFSFESSSFKKIQLLPELIRQSMADQGLIGYRFDRGRFSNGANLERIHFDTAAGFSKTSQWIFKRSKSSVFDPVFNMTIFCAAEK